MKRNHGSMKKRQREFVRAQKRDSEQRESRERRQRRQGQRLVELAGDG